MSFEIIVLIDPPLERTEGTVSHCVRVLIMSKDDLCEPDDVGALKIIKASTELKMTTGAVAVD